MFISIHNIGDRYAYVVGDSPADHPGAFFSSAKDFYLSGEVSSSYGSFGDAHAAASWLISERPSHVMAKKAGHYKRADEGPKIDLLTPENIMVSHYGEQIELISHRFMSLESEKPEKAEEDAQVIRSELDALEKDVTQLKELLEDKENEKKLDEILETAGKIREGIDKKFGKAEPSTKEASTSRSGISGAPFIKTFAYAAMKALQPAHEDVYIRLIEHDPETDSYNAYLAEPSNGEKDLVALRFDSDFCLTDVLPSQAVQSVSPYHSSEFFERYWEPIVTAVGHIRVPGLNVVAVPNMNSSDRLAWEAFEEGSNKKKVMAISLSGLGWKMSTCLKKEASVKITEGELKPGETDVTCINPEQDAYYLRTGKVTSIAPSSGLFLVRVDFGRGLGPVWLRIEDLEKVTLQA